MYVHVHVHAHTYTSADYMYRKSCWCGLLQSSHSMLALSTAVIIWWSTGRPPSRAGESEGERIVTARNRVCVYAITYSTCILVQYKNINFNYQLHMYFDTVQTYMSYMYSMWVMFLRLRNSFVLCMGRNNTCFCVYKYNYMYIVDPYSTCVKTTYMCVYMMYILHVN